MTISLNLSNDAELRAYVKDLIKGQVLSIVREEIKTTLKELIDKKAADYSEKTIDSLFKDTIKNAVNDEIKKAGWNEANFIKKETRKVINELVVEALSKKNVLI